MNRLAIIIKGYAPLKALASPREAIRQFTPNWFAVTMGTGILSLALAQLPGNSALLRNLGEALWFLNIGLFVLFSVMYACRWLLFFNEARKVFGHSTVSMFFGTIPMGLATLISGLLVFGPARWGDAIVPVAEALWWLDVAMALACGVLIPFMMFTRQEHSIEKMTAVWLLPVVAAEVAAACGGLLTQQLATPDAQFTVLITSYVLWAYSVPVALSILVILLLRLALHKLPHESMAASSWLALGPIGTGALSMLVMSSDAPAVFAAHGLASVGSVAAGVGVIAGMLFWGLGLWWMALAVLITARYFKQGLAFNLGWWAFTFPLGVYALATLKLGATLHLGFFDVFGQGLVGLLAVMWLIVSAHTLAGAYRGHLFVSPCIASSACALR
ncbi:MULTISPECIES: TDT family transporter [Pseudomonas syringae group]|uniref:C4-dicarboxylate transporter/malic acid transport protein n=3 Tax=Pseudomonas syringae group TaxID=136849 RepID=A0AB37QME4_9PSED|nr:MULTISPECIES: TDT family transporter [Pseudomonas syringae group]KGS14755.1 C4-dicarboxylate ABC transporter [Pseudomonas coronafaciens]KOP53125.1 C4-dicarboxylate ABC transporter [Pseudomonas coronafaciens pv. porri]KOP58051.1 C4-dicarboxylate ABC transporter [Pseudomonas coronafaciens pv. porri]KPB50337.1 C4-dicarboxylate transporter/malic acid transport protein [Pseudomonas coronafaciens pv. oryzae]KPX29540.1 C4-dicarboxylate transporter/malic acid transport protein [Pseudomonas coronafa